MPQIRDYPEATSILDTDAFAIDRLGVGTMFIEWGNLGSYDVAMGFPGFAPQGQTLVFFKAVRPFTIGSPAPAVQSAAACLSAASSDCVFQITQNGASVGTITFAAGQGLGVVNFPAPVTINAGDQLAVVTPGASFGIANLSITFAGLR